MSHLFRYPTAGAPTSTVTLNPAIVTIQEEDVQPVQRVGVAPDGTRWAHQLSANRPQLFTVLVDRLYEADWSGFTGYTNLKAFFETINWSMATFDLTHDDGTTTTVWLLPEGWRFDEGLKGEFSGTFHLRKNF